MRFLFCLGLILTSGAWNQAAWGQSEQIRWPTMNSPVVDQTGLLSSQEKYEIENWLYQYRQKGRAQVQVVIVDSLQGLPIEQYSIKLVEQWKLGSQKTDDGVLFLVAMADKKMRIEVGQGLEGALTDLQSKRILDDRVRPLFKSGQMAAGIAAGVVEIIRAVDPEYAGVASEGSEAAWPQEKKDSKILFYLFFLAIFLSFFRGGRSFLFGMLLGGLSGGRYRGGGGGFGGGGGGWSGGGGGFSGGGASSGW